MIFWTSILIVGFITTFLFRGSFIIFTPAKRFPKIVEEFLDYIPIAAMFAIAATHILFIENPGGLNIAPDKIIAGIIAFMTGWLSKNLFATLAAGMIGLWAIKYFIALGII